MEYCGFFVSSRGIFGVLALLFLSFLVLFFFKMKRRAGDTREGGQDPGGDGAAGAGPQEGDGAGGHHPPAHPGGVQGAKILFGFS